MVKPEEIASMASERWFDTLAGAGYWIGVILTSIVILGFFWFLYTYLVEHKIKVTFFPIYGIDPNDLTGEENLDQLKEKGAVLGHPKKCKGKDMKRKGVRMFTMMFPFKKTKDVPYEFRYPDGVWRSIKCDKNDRFFHLIPPCRIRLRAHGSASPVG